MKKTICHALAFALSAVACLSALETRPVNFSDERNNYAQFIGGGIGLMHTTYQYGTTYMPWDDNTDQISLHTQNAVALSYEIMDDQIGLGGLALLGFYDYSTLSFNFVPSLTGFVNAYLYDEYKNKTINPFVTLALGVFPLVSPAVGLGGRLTLLQDFSLKLMGLVGWKSAGVNIQACYRFGID